MFMLEKLKDQIAAHPDNAILWIILMLSFVVSIAMLVRWQIQGENGFDLKDLISIRGKVSSSKMARLGAFMVSTWCFIYLTANDKLTEWYFMGYMAAWVGNALYNSYLVQKDANASSASKKKPKESPEDKA